jgi:hypothetical protein
MKRDCQIHRVPCPTFAKQRGDIGEDDQCIKPATCSVEEPCPIHGSHTVWLCAEHYDWVVGIKERLKNLQG